MSGGAPLDLVVVGGVTHDLIVHAPEAAIVQDGDQRLLALPYGAKVHLDEATFAYGGGAANVAVVAARLGLHTGVLSRVGEDHVGTGVLEHLFAEGVDVAGVHRDPSARTGVSMVLIGPGGDRTVLVHAGANAHLSGDDLDEDLLLRARWVYVSSLRGEAGPLFDRVAAWAADHGAGLALNPGATQVERGTAGLHVALSACDVLLVNEEEARALLRDGHGLPPQALAASLSPLTRGVVVVTSGADGSVAVAPDGTVVQQPAAGHGARCTLGAGDAFGATLVAELSKDVPLGRAMAAAAINAAAVVEHVPAHDGALHRIALDAALDAGLEAVA